MPLYNANKFPLRGNTEASVSGDTNYQGDILNTKYEYFSLPFKNLVVKQTIRNSDDH
ncbi:MAG TPA: hypothetical protein VF220_07710 [Nitrososphaeraceae archaeon]